jgi:hypothetical protein
LADQKGTAPQQVTGFAHALGINVGLGQGAAASG